MGLNRRDREAILRRLRRDARVIADHFGLEYRGIESERANVRARYGACYSDGLIKIRLWNLQTSKPLKYSSLIDTLCHELAHLRHFDHGRQFKRLHLQILAWARAAGIYRPRQRGSAVEPPPARLRLPVRDGVAVFAGSERAEPPPWERYGPLLPASEPPRGAFVTPEKKRPAVPQQLSLLDAEVAGTEHPPRSATPRREAPPVRVRTAPRQLGLFRS